MQYIKFNLDEFRYVLPITDVVEIIPYVKLTTLPNLPDYFSGLCNYRGFSVPVIDLSSLFLKKSCSKKLSTRIIIIEIAGNNSTKKMVGLMVEKATEIVKVEEDSFMDAGAYGDELPYLGPVAADGSGLISRIFPGEIFSQMDSEILFPTS